MESLWGVEGLFYYRVGQWRLTGDLLLGSPPLRESAHTQTVPVFHRPLNAETADVETRRCTWLQILSLPVYT